VAIKPADHRRQRREGTKTIGKGARGASENSTHAARMLEHVLFDLAVCGLAGSAGENGDRSFLYRTKLNPTLTIFRLTAPDSQS